MRDPGHFEFVATVVAIVGAEMIFGPAFGTVGRQFSAWHCDKRSVVTFNDL